LTDIGWAVASCPDGVQAAEVLAGNKPFDLLIFDYDLPGKNGLELLRHVRSLPHRRRVPSIMFSASDVETEAWRAGADTFLRKPEDVGTLAATVTRLLTKHTK
jgi:CheY-like chemotaxis protein